MQIRDRVKELRRVRAGELRPSARNWRVHPEAQQNALRGVLAEVGFADALLVRELEDGSLHIIDGHLRAETTPDALLPVLVLDVTAEEATKILLTHDTLTGLAEADEPVFAELVAECEFESPDVEAMLAGFEAELAEGAEKLADTEPPDIEVPEMYQVLVECADEADQERVYERMREEGYRCRVLTL